MNIMVRLSTFWLQIFIIIQLLVQNDLTLSVVINMSELKFSNYTKAYSSVICLLCAIGLFSLLIVPMGLISNNKVKHLFSDYMLLRVGAYYSNVRLVENSQFLNYYIVYAMLYSLFYSLILTTLGSMPKVQTLALFILNFVYLVISFMRPYKARIMNAVNIVNHVIIVAVNGIAFVTLSADSYEDYPTMATLASVVILGLIFTMVITNFLILYMRLLPAFIIGVKKGCKFNSLEKFSKEERNIDGPKIVLPEGQNAGRIEYNEQDMRSMVSSVLGATRVDVGDATIEMDKTGVNMTAIGSTQQLNIEEAKTRNTGYNKERINLYTDDAI